MTDEETEQMSALRLRVESLEAHCLDLLERVSALEATEGTAGQPEFHMPDEEPTV